MTSPGVSRMLGAMIPLVQRLERGWRVLATGFCFGMFGVGGLVLRLVLFPILGLVVRNPVARERAAQAVIHRSFRMFLGLMCYTGVMRYDIIGAHKLARPGRLILANHPSLIDVVILIGLIPASSCIVKGALARNPFTKGPIRVAGYVHNDDGAGLLEACVGTLARGSNLIVFPEGTRTTPGQPPRLMRGAANVAVRGGYDVTPVLIRCDPPTLLKGEPWYRVPRRAAHFTITVRDDVMVAPFLAGAASAAVAARQLTEHVRDIFLEEAVR